jgi:hypothetical protein
LDGIPVGMQSKKTLIFRIFKRDGWRKDAWPFFCRSRIVWRVTSRFLFILYFRPNPLPVFQIPQSGHRESYQEISRAGNPFSSCVTLSRRFFRVLTRDRSLCDTVMTLLYFSFIHCRLFARKNPTMKIQTAQNPLSKKIYLIAYRLL